MSESNFSPELLAMYYDRLFPYEQFAKWLSYDQGANLLSKREFSFTLADDVYLRYKSFSTQQEMKDSIVKNQPYKIDIGAVFKISPADKGKVKDSEFQPMQRELVFDVDLTDYDDVRTCCSGASICIKCWKFMIAAAKVMDVALREDFGFQHIMWVYSGRRGIHCWVADETARMLTNEARTAVIQYFSVVEGNENTKRKVVLRDPVHPALERAYEILTPIFEQHIVSDDGQAILAEPMDWKKVLDMIPDPELRSSLDKSWSNPKCALNSSQKWMELKEVIQRICSSSSKKKGEAFKRGLNLRNCIAEIVLAYSYPRLDANVSKQRNHLLKSPFAIHPKTGRVCIPLDVERIEQFDPLQVPTLTSLEEEINRQNPDEEIAKTQADVGKTSLAEHVKFFESSFIKPIQNSLAAERKAYSERNAAVTGDW